jgi:DNA-binding IclR family transcriptional regulator
MKINAARRVLRVWQALKGNTFTGLSNSEIAQMLGDSPANVSRALTTLIAEDLVTKLPSGRFAHSVKTLQIAAAHYDHTQRMKQRIDQMQGQISAGTR